MIHIHTHAKKVGNSWAVIIPKEQADVLHLSEQPDLCISVQLVPKLKELAGTFKTRKSTVQLMKEIDEGWD